MMPTRFDDVSTPTLRAAVALAAALAMSALGPPTATAQEADSADEQADDAGDQDDSGDGTLQRGDRMEFDARLIRGERASGAVFLFQRAPRELPSMVERRRTFLEASVRSVLGARWAEKFVENRAEHVDDPSDAEAADGSNSEGDETSDDATRLSIGSSDGQ